MALVLSVAMRLAKASRPTVRILRRLIVVAYSAYHAYIHAVFTVKCENQSFVIVINKYTVKFSILRMKSIETSKTICTKLMY